MQKFFCLAIKGPIASNRKTKKTVINILLANNCGWMSDSLRLETMHGNKASAIIGID